MLTIDNLKPHVGGIDTIKDRAACLVQGMARCPLDHVLRALIVFDQYNSPGTKSPNAKRWIYQFAGFESDASGKAMEPIIQIRDGDEIVSSKNQLAELIRDIPHAA